MIRFLCSFFLLLNQSVTRNSAIQWFPGLYCFCQYDKSIILMLHHKLHSFGTLPITYKTMRLVLWCHHAAFIGLVHFFLSFQYLFILMEFTQWSSWSVGTGLSKKSRWWRQQYAWRGHLICPYNMNTLTKGNKGVSIVLSLIFFQSSPSWMSQITLKWARAFSHKTLTIHPTQGQMQMRLRKELLFFKQTKWKVWSFFF